MKKKCRSLFSRSGSEKKKNDLRSRSRNKSEIKMIGNQNCESEMKKLRDQEVKFLENLKIIPDMLFLGSAPSSNG